MKKYVLKCLECGTEYQDDYLRLKCDAHHSPSLLRSIYSKKRIDLDWNKPGMFRFYDFLPVEQFLEVKGGPVTYRSEGLARHLGLENLYIIFNGYWPERNALMKTVSFKELEAPSVMARASNLDGGAIVVASAGNTGRAFAGICSRNNMPLVLVIPESSAAEIWSTEPFNEQKVKLFLASGNSDYYDAISLAEKITCMDGFFPEGGTANIARRDGMATTVLDAAYTMGRIPHHYFQAIGSGAGGIAAWEAFERLKEDRRFGNTLMKLHFSQNHPFVPMVEAWKQGLDHIPAMDENNAKDKINQISAKVLSNRKPPYSITGGVRQVLEESGGEMYSVTNQEVYSCVHLFQELEGVDICEAAGVAVGSLVQAVREKKVDNQDYIALNITGGGYNKLRKGHNLYYLSPCAKFTDREIASPDIMSKPEEVFTAV
ncbi:MAG: cysteate synthase [Spirochaetota bacterium]